MSFENPAGLPATEEPMAKADFHGRGGELFLIWLVNGVLTALTLGIYFAWGKAKLYRFFYSSTEFAGSRFRFTGTGKEIFIGTVKAVGVLLVLFAALVAGQLAAGAAGVPALNFVLGAVFYVVLAFLSQYAIYATMAYRASRARYREIAFHLAGNPWTFAKEAMPYLLLAVVTLGLALPYYTQWKIGRIYNNLRFGNLPFAWDAKPGDYVRLALKGFFLSLLTLGIYYFFWAPQWVAFVRRHLSIGGCRFHGQIKPGELFGMMITNVLLVFVTFGIGTPWALTRTMRFFAVRLELENPSRLEAALQVRGAKVSAGGEAVADAMDMGVGIGL